MRAVRGPLLKPLGWSTPGRLRRTRGMGRRLTVRRLAGGWLAGRGLAGRGLARLLGSARWRHHATGVRRRRCAVLRCYPLRLARRG